MKSLRLISSSEQWRKQLFRLSTFALMLTLLGAQLASGSARSRVRRIHFQRGATTTSVHGRLRGINDKALFVVRARQGQHMQIEITGRGPTRGFITSPSGAQNGGPGGIVFDEDLTETGDYRIRVTESQMGNEWRGTFILKVTITG